MLHKFLDIDVSENLKNTLKPFHLLNTFKLHAFQV